MRGRYNDDVSCIADHRSDLDCYFYQVARDRYIYIYASRLSVFYRVTSTSAARALTTTPNMHQSDPCYISIVPLPLLSE